MVAKANAIPNPYLLSYAEVTDGGAVFSIAPNNFGVLGSPLLINADTAAFSCGKRLCLASEDFTKIKLLNAESPTLDAGQTLTFNKKHYLVASVNKELVLIRV